jgi:signal transduction histidine kinase
VARPSSAGAEDRVAAFAELVSYAIENAETRDELAASRARLVEAADEARRRIERDPARGIHPTVLTNRGLEAALDALVRRAPVPVDVRAVVSERLDTAIEAAA